MKGIFDFENNKIFAYNRVSTEQQHLDRGRETIHKFCDSKGYPLEDIYEDEFTGKVFDRPAYKTLKNKILRKGDVLIIPEYDRFGRNYQQSKRELLDFEDKGIIVMFLDIPTTVVDLRTEKNEITDLMMKQVSDTLISFQQAKAESEIQHREKRQREGYQAKRKRVEQGLETWNVGRPQSLTDYEFYKLFYIYTEQGFNKTDMQKVMNISRQTFYNYYYRIIKTNLFGNGSEILQEIQQQKRIERKKDLLYELDELREVET